MKKKDIIKRATEILKENEIRKAVPAVKSQLYIRDEEGNESKFVVKCERRSYQFNEDDVDAILDALFEVMRECMREGNEMSIYGIGTLGLHYIKPRRTVMIDGSGERTVEGHFIPRFYPGKYLRTDVKTFEMNRNGIAIQDEPEIEEEDGD